MKKISLLLFGALFALGAGAQTYTRGEWRLDSVITTTSDGNFISRQVCKYNDKGLLSELYGEETQDGSIYNTKSIFTYNDQGVTATQELYLQSGADWRPMSSSVVLEYEASNGMPKVIESTGATVALITDMLGSDAKTKTVITKWHGNQFEEEEVYLWLGGDWQKSATSTATYNSSDLMVKMVTTISFLGFEVSNETDYEYDSHGNITKEFTTSMGTTTDVTYVNEYDSDDNLVKVTSTSNGETTVSNNYWSRGGTSGLNSVKTGEGASQWFDLSGRRLGGKPTKQGIYIRDGKKYIIR